MAETCAACGAPMEAEHNFCERCGAPVVRPRFCGNCGSPVSAAARFCGNCGVALVPANARKTPESQEAGETFRDAPKGGVLAPLMVVVPPGDFLMGSPISDSLASKSEFPQHRVAIDYAFAAGKYPVTREEYGRFVAAGAAAYRPLETEPALDDHPITGLRWEDAKAYCRWLSEETGAAYRLLSEAEWEYVCRAGSQTAFWWGDEIGKDCCNCGDSGGFRTTSPVDAFAPNPFGLHDIHGNVSEWVEDCWHDNYLGAPEDGRARTGGDELVRIVRGGSWSMKSRYARAASRSHSITDFQSASRGFRVARDLKR